MDAPCKIQGSIHVFRLVNNMCPGKWVHIKALLLLWRRDRDLNPGYGITAHMISNHAPSAARTPLHVFCCVTGTCIVYEKVRFMSSKKIVELLHIYKAFKI